ncbi:MAG: hypothetical protein GY832_24315 [Chloroflexi bacterium]|nr:hypothetical protein [Chloroflexota bacterium]
MTRKDTDKIRLGDMDDLFGPSDQVDDQTPELPAPGPTPATAEPLPMPGDAEAADATISLEEHRTGVAHYRSIFEILGIPPGTSESEATVFDIETGPLPRAEVLANTKPFDVTKVKGYYDLGAKFDPSTVKYGQMKDKAKRADKLKLCIEKHNKEQVAIQKAVDGGEEAWAAKAMEDAALHAETGRVVAIGCKQGGRETAIHGWTNPHKSVHGERTILRDFWEHVSYSLQRKHPIIGFNSDGFDWPFLVKRSQIMHVAVPLGVMTGRYWNKLFVDLMPLWNCFDRSQTPISLNRLAGVLGVGGKPDDCTGAQFAEMWLSGDKEKRAIARNYLANDLDMTWGVARRMGVVA